MEYVFPVLIIITALGLAAWWIRHALMRRGTDAQALLLLQNQMQAGLTQTTQQAETLQKHLGNAQKRYEEADKRLGRVEVKIEQMSGFSKAVEGEAPAGTLPSHNLSP